MMMTMSSDAPLDLSTALPSCKIEVESNLLQTFPVSIPTDDDVPLDLSISNRSSITPSLITPIKAEFSIFPPKRSTPWTCELCLNSYTKVSNLRRHQRLCHADKMEELATMKCELCSHRFFDKIGLRIHMSQSHRSNPNSTPTLRKSRKPSKSEDGSSKPSKGRYSCRFCVKTFVYSMAVREHERLMHRPEMEVMSDAATYCLGCMTQFPSAKSLQAHLDQSERCEAAIEHRRQKLRRWDMNK